MPFVNFFGNAVSGFFIYLGEVAQLAGETFASILKGRIRFKLVLDQIAEIGYRSQLVVIVTGAFTGAVFTAQVYFQFASLGMGTAVGSVVALSMFRELGPVLTGLMVAGRVGAADARGAKERARERGKVQRRVGVHARAEEEQVRRVGRRRKAVV